MAGTRYVFTRAVRDREAGPVPRRGSQFDTRRLQPDLWMMRRLVLVVAAASVGTLLLANQAAAAPSACQKRLTKAAAVLTKKAFKRVARCLDQENDGKLPGPCPDPITAAKLAIARQKIERKIETACTVSEATALGFGSSCTLLAPEGSRAGAACADLAVTTSAQLAACVTCWQRADLFEFMALLYASHSVELCGGTIGVDSSVCSQGGCASMLDPLPDQRALGRGGESDCQQGIAKAAIKYLSKRFKLLRKCSLAGGTRESCLATPTIQLRLARADAKRSATIARECAGRRPVSNRSFCCRTSGNACIAAADPSTCLSSGGQVQEDKVCGSDGRCDPVPGGQVMTWWSQCPQRSCENFPIAALADLSACVRGKADEVVDRTLCSRFPARWSCPSSSALAGGPSR